MTERKVGRVVSWRNLSPLLAIFRVVPENGSNFPDYRPGQYIALGRENCRLTRKVVVDGKLLAMPDLDESGRQKTGPVTHSYSIASAPFETRMDRHLEFFLVLERDRQGHTGRLTESLFHMNLDKDNSVLYLDRVQGDFTLESRVPGCKRILLVGTGTGTAPFVSMIKQQHHEAAEGRGLGASFTLIHVSRTREELGYENELRSIEQDGKLDFVYVPAVSRPGSAELEDRSIGVGRANNLLRRIFDMPLKEEEELQRAAAEGGDEAAARAALEKTVRPEFPRAHPIQDLRKRLNPEGLVVLSCGNAGSLADIQHISSTNRIRFEREEW